MFARVKSVVEQLCLGDHVCWPVDGGTDRMDAVSTLVSSGIEAGQQVLCLTGSLTPAVLVEALASRGVPVRSAQRRGQVEVLPAREVQLTGGRFDGYPALRLVADMDWVLDEPSGVENLARFEEAASRLVLGGRAA